jgi:hypothetical protein
MSSIYRFGNTIENSPKLIFFVMFSNGYSKSYYNYLGFNKSLSKRSAFKFVEYIDAFSGGVCVV